MVFNLGQSPERKKGMTRFKKPIVVLLATLMVLGSITPYLFNSTFAEEAQETEVSEEVITEASEDSLPPRARLR